jgi:3-oxoacyl-[acyl-carrier protein] reductase
MADGATQREGSALVTGASRGIGAAIARALARDGWRVGVNYRSDREGAEAVVAEIERDGGEAVALAADVADPGAPDELFGALESRFDGPVLVLVNNAGISRDDLTPSLGDEEWDSVLQTNLTAAFRLTRRALKAMLRARSGRIVNISSAVALRANPGQANYAAAKAGVAGMTRALAREIGSRGITVNCVAPGFIDTDMTKAMPSEVIENAIAQTPKRRLGKPEEVARLVRFLLDEKAGYITGAVYNINGGWYM